MTMTNTPDRLKRGDRIRVRLAGSADEWAHAFVALASDGNPSSVMLWFMNGGEAVRTASGGVIYNALPLSVDYAGETVESLFGDSYEIEVSAYGA